MDQAKAHLAFNYRENRNDLAKIVFKSSGNTSKYYTGLSDPLFKGHIDLEKNYELQEDYDSSTAEFNEYNIPIIKQQDGDDPYDEQFRGIYFRRNFVLR